MLNYFTCIVKVFAGLFIPNKHYSIPSKILQIVSRFSWEIPQNILGLTAVFFYALTGKAKQVIYSNGTTIIQSNSNFGGFTLGPFIVGNAKITGNPSQRLFQHEYGHYLQSMISGPIYLFKYALPSVISSYRHDFYGHCVHPVEQDANVRAKSYWDKHYEQTYTWDTDYNPIYKELEPAFMKWYDFLPVYFPLIHFVKAFKK